MIADAIDLWLVDDEPLDAMETLRQKAATLLEAQREGIAAELHLVEPRAMTDEELTAYPRLPTWLQPAQIPKTVPDYFRNRKTADVLSAYFRMGFVRVNGRGRHHKLRHERLNLTMIVHRHRGNIPQGTLSDAVRSPE